MIYKIYYVYDPRDRMAAALQRALQNKLGKKILAEQFSRVELGEKMFCEN